MSRYDIDKKPQSLAELEPLILAAQAELSALCNGKRLRMSIPVDDADSDMVIGDALRHSLAFVRAALPPSSPVADSPTPSAAVKAFGALCVTLCGVFGEVKSWPKDVHKAAEKVGSALTKEPK